MLFVGPHKTFWPIYKMFSSDLLLFLLKYQASSTTVGLCGNHQPLTWPTSSVGNFFVKKLSSKIATFKAKSKSKKHF